MKKVNQPLQLKNWSIFFGACVILYLLFCISKFSQTESAYLYVPQTDNIYYVELVFQPNKYNKFEILKNPFKPNRLLPAIAQKRSKKLKEHLENAKLLRDDGLDEYLKKSKKDRDTSINELRTSKEFFKSEEYDNFIKSESAVIIDYLDIQLLYRDMHSKRDPEKHLEQLRKYIPEQLLESFTSDKSYLNNNNPASGAEMVSKKLGIQDIYFVDAIISETYLGLKNPVNKPADIKIFKPAVLFKGTAYYIFDQSLL